MKARTITKAAGRGTTEVALSVGIAMSLTVFAGVGLAITPVWAEMGTRLQKERSLTDALVPSEKASSVHLAGAQFFGPPPPEKATDYGVRFIHSGPHMYDGHRPYHDEHRHANIAAGGALTFNWTFGK